MDLLSKLSRLETDHMISLSQVDPELEYMFTHTLVQEAAYSSLLKSESRQLHRLAAEAIEALNSGRLEKFASLLAHHFIQAGEEPKALHYSSMAGEQALLQGATQEALEHYTQALEIAGRAGSAAERLRIARGMIYDTLGDYDLARQDLQTALDSAQERNQAELELEALISLGLTWAARDYKRTGEYYQQALKLARTLDDPLRLAESLNRLGNWYANVDHIQEALALHAEALTLFRQAGDRGGVAATLDLMSMTNALGGNNTQAFRHGIEASVMFRELNQSHGLVSSLAVLALGAASYETRSEALPVEIIPHAQDYIAEAVNTARSLSWRAGEAFTLFIRAQVEGSYGKYSAALSTGRQSLDLASQIGHLQWMTGAHFTLGAIFEDILTYEQARIHLEAGLELARKINSTNWILITVSNLASVYIQSGQLDQAQALLDDTPRPQTIPKSGGQRLVLCARAELAIARGNTGAAMERVERLIAHASTLVNGRSGLAVVQLHAKMLEAQREWEQSGVEWRAAHGIAETFKFPGVQWRCRAGIGRVLVGQGKQNEAAQEFQAARMLVDQLAAEIEDATLRDKFRQRAFQFIS